MKNMKFLLRIGEYERNDVAHSYNKEIALDINPYTVQTKEVCKMLEFRYDTQLLIEGEDLDEDVISEYFTEHFKGDCLLAVGDEELIKIHFHTNEPWKVLEYCASLGEIYDIVVEDMDRQARGLKADGRTGITFLRQSP